MATPLRGSTMPSHDLTTSTSPPRQVEDMRTETQTPSMPTTPPPAARGPPLADSDVFTTSGLRTPRSELPSGRNVFFAPQPYEIEAAITRTQEDDTISAASSSKPSPATSKASTPCRDLSPSAQASPSAVDGNDVAKSDRLHPVISACSSGRNSAATTLVDLNLSNQLRGALGYPPKNPGYPTLTPVRTPMSDELEEGRDPLEWSTRYKAWANTTYCILILSTTYGSSAFAPSVTQLVREWGIDRHLALAGTSMYVLGFALGPFIMAPCSEVFGRKPVYVLSFIFLTVFNVIVSQAPNIEVFLTFRFLAGFCGSSALNNVAASIVDMTRTRNRLRYNTLYRIVSFGGPTLGPFAGSWMTERVGWRWNMRVLPIFSFFALCLYAFTVPESHRPTLLRKQQQRWRKELQRRDDLESKASSGPEDHNTRSAAPTPSLKERLITALKRPFVYLFTEPLVMIVCFYQAILYGMLYGLLGAFPYAFMDLRGLSRLNTSWMYLSILLGFVIGAAAIGCLLQDRQFKRAWDTGTYTPESRIGPAVWGSFAVPIGLFIFAWTAPYPAEAVHWLGPCTGMVVFAFGMQLTFNSWLSYLGDAYGPNSASAMAAATFSRSMLGAAFPLFMKDLVRGMTLQGTMSMFAGISIPLSLCGVLFVKHGASIRKKSRHAIQPQESD